MEWIVINLGVSGNSNLYCLINLCPTFIACSQIYSSRLYSLVSCLQQHFRLLQYIAIYGFDLTSCIMKPLRSPFLAMKPDEKLKSRGQLVPFVGNPALIKKRNVTQFELYSKLDFLKIVKEAKKRKILAFYYPNLAVRLPIFLISDYQNIEYWTRRVWIKAQISLTSGFGTKIAKDRIFYSTKSK